VTSDSKSRTSVLEAFKTLSARLLASDSATRTLEAWCIEHRIGDGVVHVCATPTAGDCVVDNQTLDLLRPAVGEIPRLRRVVLMRGAVTLSRAVNWYIPQRLPLGMQHILDTTNVPFGLVVESLNVFRHTFHIALTPTNLVHRAVVRKKEGQAIAVVHEHYQLTLVNQFAHDA
jgi:hypothetical protein